ncbi:MAG: M48 family metallopeptidase [Ectothiorhodospiraceae bacterium]|nr:M48 family metallopeptidase [Ectothiorhodospiraceae bacterium]
MASTHQVRTDHGVYPYTLRYTRRRTLALYVFPGGRIEARVPHGTSVGVVEDFIRARQGWLRQALDSAPSAPRRPGYQAGAAHPFLGRTIRLEPRLGVPGGSRLQGDALHLQVRAPDNADAVEAAFRAWLRRQAATVFRDRIDRWFPAIGLPAQRCPALRVRAMRSRWGSCSSAGHVNLNLWLIRAPLPCIDFVVVHELCHLREFHHGPAFHALMDRVLPDWREREQDLATHQRRWGIQP